MSDPYVSVPSSLKRSRQAWCESPSFVLDKLLFSTKKARERSDDNIFKYEDESNVFALFESSFICDIVLQFRD